MEKFTELERETLAKMLLDEGDDDLALQIETEAEITDPDQVEKIKRLLKQAFWFDDYSEEIEEFQVDEYDISATPNDFNIMTIFSFLESGAVKIPGFQRNYVWDIKRASKLIESLLLGLPVPQVFLYEEARNQFLVVDGQQRLMSIYYFMKQRFPRKEKRTELRAVFAESDRIPDELLGNDSYFTNFKLRLPTDLPGKTSKFHGLTYDTLGDYKSRFDLRPIRNVVIKQISPTGDDSSIHEIFNRLNTGGTNLRPQEIRSSLHHSTFYDMLHRINALPEWRGILQAPGPDLHMKDVEILLRGFAMLIDEHNYAPSLTKFLNQFSRKCQKNTNEENEYAKKLFESFLNACKELPNVSFINKKNGRFNIALFEAVFVATCEARFKERGLIDGIIESKKVKELENDPEFVRASLEGTTGTANVNKRLERARHIVGSL